MKGYQLWYLNFIIADIGEANDANEWLATDDWDVMNAAFLD
jgi:hypothetical protein